MAKNKYIVFKKDEFQRWWSQSSVCQTQHEIPLPFILQDAEVIRHHDPNAAPLFFHYASAMETLVEMAQANSIPVDERVMLDAAEHFREASVKSQNHPNKHLPN